MTNPIAPGQVSQPITQLQQEVRELRRLVEELQRKDLSNANVGQGGRLRALYSNGNEALQTGKDPVDGANKTRISYSNGGTALGIGPGSATYGSQETMVMRDLAGNTFLQVDELAGAGLSAPICGLYPFGCMFEGSGGPTLALGTEYVIGQGGWSFYHPALQVAGFIGTGATFDYRIRLLNGAGTQVATSSTTTGVAGSSYFTKMLVVPNSLIGAQSCLVQLLVKPSAAAGPFTLFPTSTSGFPLSIYNINPQWQ